MCCATRSHWSRAAWRRRSRRDAAKRLAHCGDVFCLQSATRPLWSRTIGVLLKIAKDGIRRSGDTREDRSMFTQRSGSVASYVTIAVAAAILSAVGTWSATQFVANSTAQPAAPATGQLLTQPLADLPGREVRISLLDREPGASSARHRHPGHHTFGYVIEGTYEFAINGEPSRTLKAGDTFYEPPTAVHSTSRNPRIADSVPVIADSF
jgi:quercetin dioxygenase-like cupin family protein